MSGASSTSPSSAPSWSRRSCKAGNPSNSLQRVLPNSICRSIGPISAASWRADERPSTEFVQAKAWALFVERADFPRGDCINAGQRKAAKADRKSTRLNSSHLVISYAVFCLKKKNQTKGRTSATQKKQKIQ